MPIWDRGLLKGTGSAGAIVLGVMEAMVPAEGAQKTSAARLLQSDAVLGNDDGIWSLARNQNIKQGCEI